MVKKYTKKPVEIKAIQWTGDNIEEIYEFVGISNLSFNSKAIDQEIGELYIKTLEGDMHASINDFIIKGIKGEFYPCKPDIFYETYSDSSIDLNYWINTADRLPTKEEYLIVKDKDINYYTRLLIAYQTDTVMYDIGYYDGYKWFTDKHRMLHDVIAWKPFIKYEKDGN